MSLRSVLVSAAILLAAPVAAQAQAFPVTLEHVWGSTTIEAAPQRVVTWGWGNEDAAIALGVIPVGMPFQSYGGGEDGIQPWIEDALAAAGAATPVILDNAGEPPFEQIAALEPDLILAVFSGVTEEQYALLSAIAPTVAYTGDAWSTPWQDVTRQVGAALGKADEAEAMVDETEAWLASEFAKYPELAEVTFASANDYDGAMAVLAPLDARIKFLTDLGMTLDPSVATLAPDDGQFYYPLSYELFDQLEADIFVTYNEEQAALDTWLATPQAQTYPPIVDGGLAALVGTENVAAVSPPSALSLRWGFPTYLEVLATAAQAVTNR
ncbi:iron-siderophore ABC transporter substrate-binding protein [Devosia sediminis]|uniref:Iron-siderophore ABC transporter substrate-binding protein n=1 Tax=Devosia sediminis TaxID=2798801 RepID=A0A934IYM3_9HYPH|nr:iron-siderophore ABC transporter substrate-binding protein [Devosia sediminis]MBJ3785485.1 iron-siderophore ABC transporter substrate-binding protein [Devosia sediminis]